MQKHNMNFQTPGLNARYENGLLVYDDERDPEHYEYYEYEEDASKNSWDMAEEEYIQFLYEYGH